MVDHRLVIYINRSSAIVQGGGGSVIVVILNACHTMLLEQSRQVG
jgi:hypothetical protein